MNQLTCKNIVVGAGLSGLTIANLIASRLFEPVLIIERRPHIGGNIYDTGGDAEESPYRQLYGAHIFHTNDIEVWDFLSQFTSWRPYTHRVVASIDGQKISVPFNLRSLHDLYPESVAFDLERLLVSRFGFDANVTVFDLMNDEKADIKNLGHVIYEKIYKNYSAKQWGTFAKDIDKNVLNRVPVRVNNDSRYFRDTYQALPSNGYASLAAEMMKNPLIEVKYNTDFAAVSHNLTYSRLFFTGCIDQYFGFRYGALPYRSLRFENVTHYTGRGSLTPVVNYPNEYGFTRVIENACFEPNPGATRAKICTYEYPQSYSYADPSTEPFYPVPTQAASDLYARYGELARALPNVHFLGRLGRYKYLNMDAAVREAIDLFNHLEK